MSGERLKLPEDDGPCQNCGERALDTGWECTECGFDNIDWYYPQWNKEPLTHECIGGKQIPADGGECTHCGAGWGDKCKKAAVHAT